MAANGAQSYVSLSLPTRLSYVSLSLPTRLSLLSYVSLKVRLHAAICRADTDELLRDSR